MKKSSFSFFILIQVISCSTLSSGSVCNAAGIAGTITDQSGAVLVDAQVVLRETATGIERESLMEGTGRFQFDQVQPGFVGALPDLQPEPSFFEFFGESIPSEAQPPAAQRFPGSVSCPHAPDVLSNQRSAAAHPQRY